MGFGTWIHMQWQTRCNQLSNLWIVNLKSNVWICNLKSFWIKIWICQKGLYSIITWTLTSNVKMMISNWTTKEEFQTMYLIGQLTLGLKVWIVEAFTLIQLIAWIDDLAKGGIGGVWITCNNVSCSYYQLASLFYFTKSSNQV